MLNEIKIPKMATITEAAELTGLAKHYIRQLCLQNKIKYLKAGKKFLINVDKLIEFLNAGELFEVKTVNKIEKIEK